MVIFHCYVSSPEGILSDFSWWFGDPSLNINTLKSLGIISELKQWLNVGFTGKNHENTTYIEKKTYIYIYIYIYPVVTHHSLYYIFSLLFIYIPKYNPPHFYRFSSFLTVPSHMRSTPSSLGSRCFSFLWIQLHPHFCFASTPQRLLVIIPNQCQPWINKPQTAV